MSGVDDSAAASAVPDIRDTVASLLAASGGADISAEIWAVYHHAYGAADDVPALLRSIGSQDPAQASEALSELWNSVRHQGGTSPAAALAVPSLIRAAADRAVHNRAGLIHLAALAGHRNHFGCDTRAEFLQVEEDRELYGTSGETVQWTITAARTALTAHASAITALLDDHDPRVRASAAYAIATFLPSADSYSRQLQHCLAEEAEPSVRISLVLGITQLALEDGRRHDATAWTGALWQDASGPSDLRFAAALAWLSATEAQPLPELLEVLHNSSTPETAAVLDTVPWQNDLDRRDGFAYWLVAFLGDDPATQTTLTTRLTSANDAGTVSSACDAAYRLSITRRSATPAMIELLVDHLDSRLPGVALHAARRLARTGAAAAPHTLTIAEHVQRHTDPELRAWLTTILAHCGDPLACDPLTELLLEPPWPFGILDSHPDRLIDHMTPYAASLIDAVGGYLERTLLSPDRITGDLIAGLAAWGRDAQEASWSLLPFLGGAPSADTAVVVTTLGRISPIAEYATWYVDCFIDSHRDDTQLASLAAALWARWRITGDRADDTAARLAAIAATPPHGPDTLRYLADMGLAAAAAEPVVRNIFTNPGWYIERLEAAHALARITGDSRDALPVYLRMLDKETGSNYPDSTATIIAEYLAELGAAATPALPHLIRLRDSDHRTGWAGMRHDPISADEHHLAVIEGAIQNIGRQVGSG